MSNTFLALQCFQCSTMQVKQQKKSSNKWVCAVCNQRQSVRKVHARGPLASDLRKFVQSFNMLRATSSHAPQPGAVIVPSPDLLDAASDRTIKKRTDWTEYLDPSDQDDAADDGDAGALFESERWTTEPARKKVAFQKCPRPAAAGKPAFPLQKMQESGARLDTVGAAAGKPQRTANGGIGASGSSKWSKYLDGDEDDGVDRNTSFLCSASGICNEEIEDGRVRNLRVEDEVHPDFI